jgi:hypothetical protein
VIGLSTRSAEEHANGITNDHCHCSVVSRPLTGSGWPRRASKAADEDAQDAEAAELIGDGVATGTVFMNRCDYIDPELAWTGVKDTGHGAGMGPFGFEAVTRPKSFQLRLEHQGLL